MILTSGSCLWVCVRVSKKTNINRTIAKLLEKLKGHYLFSLQGKKIPQTVSVLEKCDNVGKKLKFWTEELTLEKNRKIALVRRKWTIGVWPSPASNSKSLNNHIISSFFNPWNKVLVPVLILWCSVLCSVAAGCRLPFTGQLAFSTSTFAKWFFKMAKNRLKSFLRELNLGSQRTKKL